MGDLERSSMNRAAQVSTPVYLPAWDHFSSAFKSLMAKCPGGTLGFGKAYHGDSYKQLPPAPDKGRFATVAFRDPQSGDWIAIPSSTRLFGSATTAPQYNFHSKIIAPLASRILTIPAMGRFDDFGLPTPLPLSEDVLLTFTERNKISGFEITLSKSEWG